MRGCGCASPGVLATRRSLTEPSQPCRDTHTQGTHPRSRQASPRYVSAARSITPPLPPIALAPLIHAAAPQSSVPPRQRLDTLYALNAKVHSVSGPLSPYPALWRHTLVGREVLLGPCLSTQDGRSSC
jgi:hypothetical protein